MDIFQLGDFENELIGEIYQAALQPGLWRSVLQKIRDAANVDECTIFFYDAQCRARNYAAAATMPDSTVQLFLDEYIDHEAATIHENFKHIPAGTLVIPPQMEAITGEKYEQTIGDEYMEELRPRQELRAGSALIHGKIISSVMGLHSFVGAPPISADTILFLERIVSHMSNAMHIHNHINRIEQSNLGLQETLNRINMGVFLLNKDARVAFLNPEAARILETSNALSIGHGAHLQLMNETENAKLQMLVREMAEASFKSKAIFNHGIHIAVRDKEKTHPFKLTLIPVEDTEEFSGVMLENIHVLVLVNDPERPCIIPHAYLKKAYSLTDTECVIIQSLLNDLTINKVAEERGTTIETARWQLKTIMQKTGTHSQAELSRLLMALSGDFNASL